MVAADPDPSAGRRRRRGQPSLLMAIALGTALLAVAARAELPPWVYGQQQREAPLVVELSILAVETDAAGFRVQGRVLAVRRQRRPAPVRVGSRLWLRLPPLAATGSAPALPGPAPLQPPRPGARLTAWLEPGPSGGAPWLPAAGGRSFGPTLEAVREPRGS